MKNSGLSYKDHIYFPVLLFIAATFPLPIAYNSIGVITLLIVFLADYKNFRNNMISYYRNKRNLLLLININSDSSFLSNCQIDLLRMMSSF